MKMTSDKRAIDKVYKRRDRYEIPDWQRGEVWDRAKKQRLIDSILRGWKLPKFYFVKTGEDSFLVEDGQQRLAAIYDFFSNSLPLSAESAQKFNAIYYRELSRVPSDAFDDFTIEYDIIEEASDEELKEFFLRLQEGMSLSSSEKLNAVHSKLRDFCRSSAKHAFFTESTSITDTRFAYFDVMAKVVTLDLDGLDAGLRLDDVKAVFQQNANFSPSSAAAKRIKGALDFIHKAFRGKGQLLRTRTLVQSTISLALTVVKTGKHVGLESRFANFFEHFTKELADQVELGQAATDSDYLAFQRSVNANVKGSAQLRQQILLRKLFRFSPELVSTFDPTVVAEAGISSRVKDVGESIVALVEQVNKVYSGKHGEDLFKATAKTAQAQLKLSKLVTNFDSYKDFIDNLYFLFRESTGARLGDPKPPSFQHVNDLRTDLRHDVDHGELKTVRAKKKKLSATFATYAGSAAPELLEPTHFPLVQANILTAIEGDLRNLLLQTL